MNRTVAPTSAAAVAGPYYATIDAPARLSPIQASRASGRENDAEEIIRPVLTGMGLRIIVELHPPVA